MVSAVVNGPKTLALHSEKTAEIKTLKIVPWVKDHILLVDLGFDKNQMFTRAEENGRFFVSRIKKSMDPIVVSIDEGVPKTKYKEFMEKLISECIQQFSGKYLDTVEKIVFKRRKYKGKQKKMKCVYVLLLYITMRIRSTIYITNIQKDVLNTKDTALLQK